MKYMEYLGAFLIIISVLIGIISYQGYKINNFKKMGVTAQAKITKKYKKESSETWGIRSIKDSPRYKFIRKTNYFCDVSMFHGSDNNQSSFKFIATSLQISKQTLSKIKKGSKVEIIYLHDNPESSALVYNDFNNHFYNLDENTYSLYEQKGKRVNAVVGEIDSANSSAKLMFTSYSISGLGKFTTATIPLDKSIYDSLTVGDSIEVVYLPEDPQNSVIAKKMLDSLIYLPPYLGIALVVLCFVAGIILLNIKKPLSH
jgi:hypothetical protein